MVDLALLELIGVLGSAGANIALVFLLYRTIKQFEATAHLSKIQIDYRFRPWIGPLNSIQALSSNEKTNQYDCTIKNYGEIPAQYVKAYCKIDTKIMDRDVFKSNPGKTFNIRTLFANRDKYLLVLLDSSLIKKAKERSE